MYIIVLLGLASLLLVLTIGILIGILTIYKRKRGNTDNQSTNLHGNLNGPSLIMYSHIIQYSYCI